MAGRCNVPLCPFQEQPSFNKNYTIYDTKTPTQFDIDYLNQGFGAIDIIINDNEHVQIQNSNNNRKNITILIIKKYKKKYHNRSNQPNIKKR